MLYDRTLNFLDIILYGWIFFFFSEYLKYYKLSKFPDRAFLSERRP